MGGITGGIVGSIITALPFGMLGRFGGLLKTVTTFSVGAGLLTIGMKKKGTDFGTALIMAGGATALVGVGQIAAMTGFGPFVGLSNFVQRAEGTLKGYETIDSVEVDKSSYQPTQNYGADEIFGDKPGQYLGKATFGALTGVTIFGASLAALMSIGALLNRNNE